MIFMKCSELFQADDQSFTAHRIVLAATIPYFKGMFTHNMVESKLPEIAIQGIDAVSVIFYFRLFFLIYETESDRIFYHRALEELLNFAYTGRVSIHISNVQSLMFGASFLELSSVKNACADFLKKR